MKRRDQAQGGERRSKTRRKRESESLQALGEALIELSPEELRQLELPVPLREAVEEARHIRKHEAARRQRQYIGRLMRDVDPDPVRQYLAKRDAGRQRETRFFHAAEEWRRRLLHGSAETVGECAETLGIDAEHLAEELDAVRSAPTQPLRKAASRSLFRRLHGALRRRAGGAGDEEADLPRRPGR